MKAPTKAVIPVAGLGTRFLPATKAMPKEMLPLVDKPVIQYVVEEAVRYGLRDILFVTGRDKYALENHFDSAEALESRLEEKGDDEKLALVQNPTHLGNIHYVRQGGAKGLGHAVLAARSFTGGEPFAVLLGDDVIEETSHLLERMIEVFVETQSSVVALIEVPMTEIHKYGSVKPAGQTGDIVNVSDFVEKPKAEVAPSNFAVIGRYILRPEILDIIETLEPGAGGEIQLTDALAIAARNPETSGGVVGVLFSGERYDAGDKLEYLKATIQLATKREGLGADLLTWMKQFIADK
ncbi:UTP--glucose-1-phosphate uridylyltransferase GalU [Rhodoluna limnophila]|uniref:UTP--glucose-1-phosphate uridylyltransferase GalU n=1 Tax=Rhodoluna limnophila TaxID=232537 RepID=UPI001106E735|nr:UTP--glucose-1-phosphate uridylyltransferase GalU [Rhodoluna limnophila]